VNYPVEGVKSFIVYRGLVTFSFKLLMEAETVNYIFTCSMNKLAFYPLLLFGVYILT